MVLFFQIFYMIEKFQNKKLGKKMDCMVGLEPVFDSETDMSLQRSNLQSEPSNTAQHVCSQR